MSEACLWRISQFEDLSGIGGTMVPGRWHHKGRPIVYLGDCPALCLLEILVHLEASADELPDAFTLLRASFPAREVEKAPTVDLSANWRESLHVTRQIGDDWLEAGESLLLRVPSAIVPHNVNYLFNPLHPAAAEVALSSESFPADPRLFASL
jgi:RES domain-containing protein